MGPMRVDHVGVFVSDLARSERFYRFLFRLPRLSSSSDTAFRIVCLGDARFHIALFEPKRTRARRALRIAPPPAATDDRPRLDHVAVSAPDGDVDGLLRRLRRQKVDFRGPYPLGRFRSVKVADPDGNEFELIAKA